MIPLEKPKMMPKLRKRFSQNIGNEKGRAKVVRRDANLRIENVRLCVVSWFCRQGKPLQEFYKKEKHMDLHELRNIVIELCEECDDYATLEYIFQLLAKEEDYDE